MPKAVLYSYFRSSASWRVRVALNYKGIDYDYKAVHLVKDGGQQKTEEYKSLNPMAQVPTLIIDDLVLTQSLPIIEYLEETRPQNKLIPSDPVNRFEARRIAEMIGGGIQPIQNLSVLQKVAEITGDDKKKAEWAKYFINYGLIAIEKTLEKTAGKFCVGDEVTVADIFLVPQKYNAVRFNVDMSQFPIINRVIDNATQLDAFKAADPSAQPDCPDDLKK